MSSDNSELGSALLRFLNAFDTADHDFEWKDLRDGRILWQVLRAVAPAFFDGELPKSPGSGNWIERWQNLKYIHRMVMTFIHDECGKLQEWTRSANLDLKAVAIEGSAQDFIELAKAVVIAAVYSPAANQQVVAILEKLGPKVSRPIASCIEKTIELNKTISISTTVPGPASPSKALQVNRDSELQDEQQLIEAYEQITTLELEKANLYDGLQETRQQKSDLQASIQKLTQQLESTKSKASYDKTVEKLLQTSEQDRDHIASLERDLNELKGLNSTQVKQLDDLIGAREEKRQIRDELQRLQAERAELMQIANANDNLKRKIVTLQEAAKSHETFRHEHEAAQEELRSLRRLRDRYFELQKVNEESLRVIQVSEQEIHDEMASRQKLEQEVDNLRDALETAKNERQADVDRLQDVIRDLEDSHGQDVPGHRSLDDELDIADSEEDLKTENERLKAEVTRLRTAQQLIETKDESDVASQEILDEDTGTGDDTNNMILQLIKEGKDALLQANAENPDLEAIRHAGTMDDSDSDSASSTSSQSPISTQNPDLATSNSTTNDNLRRELRLMTSAWYDVTRRIQSDAVVVQRRRDAPKSFLNRQRRLVLGVSTGIGAPGLVSSTAMPQRR